MIRRALALAGLLALSPAVSQAAVLMMVDGVIGPSKTIGYSGWFQLNHVAWSIDRSKVAEPHDVNVSLQSSATVATLIQLSAMGTPMKKIVFDDVHTMSSEGGLLLVMRVTCEEAIIRSSSISAQSDDQPVVQLNIRCGRLAWENYDFNSSTKAVTTIAKGSWNFKTNTP